MSSWDLWFEVKRYRDTTLHLKRAAADSQPRFTAAVSLATWGLEPVTWGFRADHRTGGVTWRTFWGDGSAMVPEVDWGDVLVSIDAEPWGPSELQDLPEEQETMTSQWWHAGALVERTLSKKRREEK